MTICGTRIMVSVQDLGISAVLAGALLMLFFAWKKCSKSWKQSTCGQVTYSLLTDKWGAHFDD